MFNRITRCSFATTLGLIIGLFQFPIISNGQEVFSIDRASGSPYAHGDVLIPDPTVVITDVALAFGGALFNVEIDGISSGTDDGTELLFSVDHTSLGLPGTDVSIEAAGGSEGVADHPADIYRNPLGMPSANIIYRDGDGIPNPLAAPDPLFGLREPYATALDNTDAYDKGPIGMNNYMGPIYFTVGAAAPGGFPTESIFLVTFPGGPVIPYATGLTLTLGIDDDIDAIFVRDDGDMFFSGSDFIGFSLSRTSPSLTAGSPLSIRFAAGGALSPADVFIVTGTGGAFLVPAFSHGLQFDDNIDALDQVEQIQKEILLGDVNLDGVVNLLDVQPFVELITTGTFQAEGDINEDGVVDLLDVAPFVELLGG